MAEVIGVGGTSANAIADVPAGFFDVTSAPYCVPTDGVSDCSDAIDKLIADIKAKRLKARKIVFPFNGNGGYKLSRKLYVNFSNLWMHFEDNVKLTATTKSPLIHCSGNFGADVSTYISGIKITLAPGIMLDGNGDAMTSYSYLTSDTYYSTILLQYCDRPVVSGQATITNGLVNTVRAWMCRAPLIEDLTTTWSVYDNGISIDFDPSYYSASDSTTWASAKVLRCKSYFNRRGFGITSFASTDNLFEDCTSMNNGSNDIPSGQGGVPGGGFSLEKNPTNGLSYDYRARFKNCRSEYNIGNGWFITGSGGHIDAECVSKNNTYPLSGAAVDDPANIYGTGVTLLSVSNWVVECDAENNTKYNIRYLGSSGVFGLNIKIGAKALNSQFSGISVQGIGEVIFLPTTHSRGNSVSSTGNGITVSNVSGYNQGGGKVVVLGALLDSNGGPGMIIDGVATAIIENVVGKDNGANSATSAAVIARNCGLVVASNVQMYGSNQTYALSVEATCAKSAVATSCNGQGTSGQVQNLAPLKLNASGVFA